MQNTVSHTRDAANELAIIYARYSSNAQKDVSIDQQIQACRNYATRQGLEVVEVYEDRALTGTSDKRPGFQRMISDSARGQWRYVIVYSLDRFARDRYDSAIYKRKLKENGVRVLSAMENISDDPTGVLMESVLEGLAEYYSKELAQKTQRGMVDNAEKCMVNGPVPAGYQRGSDGKYAIYEPEAVVIREVFQRTKDGDSVSDIIVDLENRGLRTRKGTPYTRNILYRALSNERYTGVYLYGSIRKEGGIPPIVSRALFDDVQLILENKPNPRRELGSPKRRRNENGLYLLTGKLYCGKCSSPMIGVSGRSKTGNIYYYYTCKKQKEHLCDKEAVRRDQIEYALTLALQQRVFTNDAIQTLADAVVAYQRKAYDTAELDLLTSQLSDTRRSIRNIISAIEQGIFAPTVQQRLSSLETEEARLSQRISVLERAISDLPTKDDIIALLSLYKDGDPKDKNYQQSILDTFLVAVYLYDDHFDLVFTIGDKPTKECIPLAPDLATALSDTAESSYKCTDGSPKSTSTVRRLSIFLYFPFPLRPAGRQVLEQGPPPEPPSALRYIFRVYIDVSG